MKILVVDDEERFRRIVSGFLKKDGYEVFEASDGNEAMNIIASDNSFDMAILDVMLPQINGWELCKIIKQEIGIPVMMLTARSEDEDQIKSFECGADDYISKPINFSIFLLRVKSLLRRASEKQEILSYKNINIDLNSHSVSVNNEELTLTRKEFEILVYLIQNKNKVLSREAIRDKVWEDNNYKDIRAVDTHIKNLRIKLKENGESIKTIRGYGYKIE